MSYTVLVFVKQVPDTQNITGDAMKADGTVNRAALPAIFNPEDLNALELALQLKDRYGVKVVVATMGLPAAADVLRQAMYRGADEGILLTDRAFAGADTLATSFALSCAAKKVKYDLILCGRQPSWGLGSRSTMWSISIRLPRQVTPEPHSTGNRLSSFTPWCRPLIISA